MVKRVKQKKKQEIENNTWRKINESRTLQKHRERDEIEIVWACVEERCWICMGMYVWVCMEKDAEEEATR